MELLVISDAHGNRAAICEALRRQVRPPDALLFLGDGLRDLPDLPDGRTALYAVAGNCDGYLPFFTEGEEREICLLSLGEPPLAAALDPQADVSRPRGSKWQNPSPLSRSRRW